MRDEFYRDDVPTEEALRYNVGSTGPMMIGGASGGNPEHSDALPLGIHYSRAERQEQRLARAGIVVVRKMGGR